MTIQDFYFWMATINLPPSPNAREEEYWLDDYYEWYLANEEVDG